MKEFSVAGSTALKEAFAKEVGISLLSSDSVEYKYLMPSIIEEKTLSGELYSKDVHFELPKDWDEAVKYAKRFFGLEKPKAGEYIKITKEAEGFRGKLGSYHRIVAVEDDIVRTDADKTIKISAVGYEIVTEAEFIESILKTRHATPEEIERLENHLPTIEGIKGQYTDTGVKYGCQEFTFEEIKFMDKIFYDKSNDQTVLIIGGASVAIAEIKQVVEIVKNRAK